MESKILIKHFKMKTKTGEEITTKEFFVAVQTNDKDVVEKILLSTNFNRTHWMIGETADSIHTSLERTNRLTEWEEVFEDE